MCLNVFCVGKEKYFIEHMFEVHFKIYFNRYREYTVKCLLILFKMMLPILTQHYLDCSFKQRRYLSELSFHQILKTLA